MKVAVDGSGGKLFGHVDMFQAFPSRLGRKGRKVFNSTGVIHSGEERIRGHGAVWFACNQTHELFREAAGHDWGFKHVRNL
jgi:hypothetical protein